MTPINRTDSETRSADVIAQNIEILKGLFPEAVSEGKLDLSVLKGLFGTALLTDEERDEKYGLNWFGKRKARQIALTPSTGTLRPSREESVDWDTTKNLMIEGDNLEVLKLLQKSYAGQVKLIYIDPPYNTGGDFIYHDNFHDSIRVYHELIGVIEGGIKLQSNVESSGRYHTDWLNMMYPRLKIARTLLKNEGLLFISISDAEAHNLRHLLDEVFGEENFVGCIEWNSTKSVTNTALISVSHTHNYIYAKNIEYYTENRSHFRLPEDGEGFDNPDNDPRGPWKADPFQVGGERPNQLYEIVNPKTGEIYKPNPGASWKNEYSVFQRLVEEKRIVFGVSGEAGPQRKRFLSEAEERGKVTKTLWDDVGTTTNGTKQLKELLGENVFDNPKPIDLIQRIIQLGVFNKQNEIVMDFFAGSGTTGHAVMLENEKDGGTRRFILVQLPEPLYLNNKEQKIAASYCLKNKLPLSISEITKQRLRKAGKIIKERNATTTLDVGFRVFKLDSSNIVAWDSQSDRVADLLRNATDHVKKNRSVEDILYEILLKYGIDLSIPIESRDHNGVSLYSIGGGTIIACMMENISRVSVEHVASEIFKWRTILAPSTETLCIFLDSAFQDDVAKTNLSSILNQNGISTIRSI